MSDDQHIEALSIEALIVRLEAVKERAVSDSYGMEMEYDVGVTEHESSRYQQSDTATVINEAIRRLRGVAS